MSNEWELVVKGGKHKAKTQISKGELKRINENNLNSNKYRLAMDEETDKSISPEQTKVTSKPKSKKGDSLKGEDDVNQQINKITSESIKKIYKELLSKFPNQTTVSLLDLAVHLSLMIKVSDETLKTINFDKTDFPYALLSNDTLNALKGIFNGLSNVQTSNFLKSAMIQLLDDHDKGIHSIGLRILIQACVRLKPTIFISNRKNFFDLLNLHREQTVKFKLLTWALRQACSNYNLACQIWLIYFLPFITQKCHTEFVISFGEEIKDYPIDGTGNDSGLLVTDFVPIIDLIFTQHSDNQNDKKFKKKQANFQLTTIQIDRLKLIYPKIKDQAFLSKSPASLKDYFASLFLRLSSQHQNGLLNQELLNCLEHCVKMCPETINQLNHLHLEYPQQTKIFLDYLSTKNSAAIQSIKKSKSFKIIMDKICNNNIAAPMGSVQDNLRKLSKKCQSNGNSSSSFLGTFFRILTYIILMGFITGGIIYYQYPQQFKLMQNHVSPYSENLIDKLTPAYKYCEERVLDAYKQAQPVILVAYDRIQAKSVELWTYLKPTINDLAIKIDLACIYIRSKLDEMFPQLINQIGEIIHSLKHYLIDLSSHIVNFFNGDEFQAWVKVVRENAFNLWNQIEQGFRNTFNNVMEMLNYQ